MEASLHSPLSKRRAGRIFNLSKVNGDLEWSTRHETRSSALTRRGATSGCVEQTQAPHSSVTMEEISRHEPPNATSPANSPSSKYSFSFPGRSPRWPHTYHQGVIFSFPAPCFGTASASHSSRRHLHPPSASLFSKRWLPSYRLPTVDEKSLCPVLSENDSCAPLQPSPLSLDPASLEPKQCLFAKANSPVLPRARRNGPAPLGFCFDGRSSTWSCASELDEQIYKAQESTVADRNIQDLEGDETNFKCLVSSSEKVPAVNTRNENTDCFHSDCRSIQGSPKYKDALCRAHATGNRICDEENGFFTEMDNNSDESAIRLERLKSRLHDRDLGGREVKSTDNKLSPRRHGLISDDTAKSVTCSGVVPVASSMKKTDNVSEPQTVNVFSSSSLEFPAIGASDDRHVPQRPELRDRRAYSMERPISSSQPATNSQRAKFKSSKVEKLRELTERLRPSSSSSSSSSSSTSNSGSKFHLPSPPPAAPALQELQQCSTLPPLPVAPPRNSRTRSERKKSVKSKKDSATSTADLAPVSLKMGTPVSNAASVEDTSADNRSDNENAPKDKALNPNTDTVRPSLFSLQSTDLQRRESLYGSDHSKGRATKDDKETDIFDDSQLTLSKLNPKILVGTYHQRTIPFRSASFSQIDVGADGTYNRRPRTSITLKPVTYSIGRDGTPVLPSGSATLPRRKVPGQDGNRTELLSLVEDSDEASTNMCNNIANDVQAIAPGLTTENVDSVAEVQIEPRVANACSTNDANSAINDTLPSYVDPELLADRDEGLIGEEKLENDLVSMKTDEQEEDTMLVALENVEVTKPSNLVPSESVEIGNYESSEISVAAEIRLSPLAPALAHEANTTDRALRKEDSDSAQTTKPLPVLDLLELNNHLLRLKVSNRQSNADSIENFSTEDAPVIEKVTGLDHNVLEVCQETLTKPQEVTPRSWLTEALRLNGGQRESTSSLSDEGCVPDSDFFPKSDSRVTLETGSPSTLNTALFAESERHLTSNEEQMDLLETKGSAFARRPSSCLIESHLGVDSGMCTKSSSSRSLANALHSKEGNNNSLMNSNTEAGTNEMAEPGCDNRRGFVFSPQLSTGSLADSHLATSDSISSDTYVDILDKSAPLDSQGSDTEYLFRQDSYFSDNGDDSNLREDTQSRLPQEEPGENGSSLVSVDEGVHFNEIQAEEKITDPKDDAESKNEDHAEPNLSSSLETDPKDTESCKSRVTVSRNLTLTTSNNEASTSNRSPAVTPFRSVSPFSFPSEADANSDKSTQRSPQTPRRYGLKRRPLRGPYGEMLEAEMNKSEMGKLYTKRSEDLSFLRELCPRNREAKSSSPRPLSPTSPVALVASSPDNVANFLTPSARQNSLPLPSIHSHSHSLDDSQLKVGYNTTSPLAVSPPQIQSRTLPKRKISANIPYVFSDGDLETASSKSEVTVASQVTKGSGRLDGTITVSHQRTSSSPSHLMCNEGGFTSEDEPELVELASANSINKPVKTMENEGHRGDHSATNISVTRAASFKRHRDTRTHVVRELYDTERSYVESLQILVTKYLQPLKSPEYSGLVEASLVDEIFYQIPDVLAHHEVFLEELRKRLEKWDAKQCVGGVFLQALTKPHVIETYMAFINHWKYAKEAVKAACQAKSAFAKFLGAMAREHKGKLALDSLLIMPVQRIPRYELLIKMLLKHTPRDHPDHPLLIEAQKEVHDLAVKINCVEREALGAEQKQATLRELESLVEGLGNLASPERLFLRHDIVTMPSALGNRKERALFLFSDLLVITSVKRRGAAIKKSSSFASSIVNTLEANKFKLLIKVSLEKLDICRTKDENNRRSLRDVEHLEEDLATLAQLGELASTLHSPHSSLDDVIKDLQMSIQRQVNEKLATVEPNLATLELAISTSEGTDTLSVAFMNAEKRASWEEAFTEAKHKLGVVTADRRPPPDFLSVLPIRKTRAGLQFTCAAPTTLWDSTNLRDVWVCNSDGYVGQVCILTLHPEPNVASCNGVCNARITCIAAVPPSTSRPDSSLMETQVIIAESQSCNYDASLAEDRDSPAGNIELESSESSDNSSSDDDSADEDGGPPSVPAGGGFQRRRGDSILADMSVHSSAEEADVTCQATMWLGTEDGSIHIYHCGENIRLKKNRVRIQQAAAVLCLVYVENQVFASLANGDIVIYTRDSSGVWNINDPQILTVGSLMAPVTRMLHVHGKIWCSSQNLVKILDLRCLTLEDQFPVSSDSQRAVLSMTGAGLGVWVAMQGSAVVRLFHAVTHECICDINLAPAVNKMLIGCDDIIRQHKAACLRVTSMMVCRELLWVGTSAGVILTVPIPHLTPTSSRFSSPPPVTGISHGHTGHVRFLTCVEATPEPRSSRSVHRYSIKGKDATVAGSSAPPLSGRMLVISGGDGYEDFRNTGFSDSVGREDSTNHLLLWQL